MDLILLCSSKNGISRLDASRAYHPPLGAQDVRQALVERYLTLPSRPQAISHLSPECVFFGYFHPSAYFIIFDRGRSSMPPRANPGVCRLRQLPGDTLPQVLQEEGALR